MSRVQLALNVSDIDAAVDFYTRLLATAPHKRRPGYANFEVADPPLKLVLIEVPASERGRGTGDALNHLGIEVVTAQEVVEHTDRLRGQGLTPREEWDTTCCHALQDKAWVDDPDGAPWEVYTVKDDNPVVLDVAPSACCTGADASC